MIKRIFIYLGLFIIALIIQSSVFPMLRLGPFTPDLPLILVVFLGLSSIPLEGVIMSFIAGLMSDLFSGSPRGINNLTFQIVFLLSFSFSRRLYVGNSFSRFVLVLSMSIIKDLTVMVLTQVYNPPSDFHAIILKTLLPSGVSTSILFILMFDSMSKLGHALTAGEIEEARW